VSTVAHCVRLAVVLLGLAMCSSPSSAEDTQGDDNKSQARADAECQENALKGQELRDAGQLLQARQHFLACARSCFRTAEQQCKRWLGELEPRIPTVVMSLRDANDRDVTDAAVVVDGAAVALDGRALTLDPGRHEVVAKVTGSEPIRFELVVVEGEKGRHVPLRMPASIASAASSEPAAPAQTASTVQAPEQVAPPPAAEPGFRVPTGAWIVGGAGVVSLLAFSYFALDAKSEFDVLQRDCAPSCAGERVDPLRRSMIAADVALGVGIAGVLGAAVWTWLESRREPERALSTALVPLPQGVAGSLTLQF
jgi:hypothetical protein